MGGWQDVFPWWTAAAQGANQTLSGGPGRDALGVGARDGVVRLDVRNEALETHMVKRSRGGVVRAADLPDLEGIWMDVWTGLEAATPPETYRVLAWLR